MKHLHFSIILIMVIVLSSLTYGLTAPYGASSDCADYNMACRDWTDGVVNATSRCVINTTLPHDGNFITCNAGADAYGESWIGGGAGDFTPAAGGSNNFTCYAMIRWHSFDNNNPSALTFDDGCIEDADNLWSTPHVLIDKEVDASLGHWGAAGATEFTPNSAAAPGQWKPYLVHITGTTATSTNLSFDDVMGSILIGDSEGGNDDITDYDCIGARTRQTNGGFDMDDLLCFSSQHFPVASAPSDVLEVILHNDSFENITSIFENTEFYIRANFTDGVGSPHTAGVCNFTAINISAHFSRTGADTTLSTASDQLDLTLSETPTNLLFDNIEFQLCRNGVKVEVEVLINGSAYDTIDQNSIPLCSSGTIFDYMNTTDQFNLVRNINLTVQCSGCGGARTIDIVSDAEGDLLHYERQFSEHKEDIVYNVSTGLYGYLNHKYHFTKSGIGKGNISVNCNGSVSNPLYDVLDVLPIVEIFTINGITYVENMSIERTTDNVSILIGVSGAGITSIQFNVTNATLIKEVSTVFLTTPIENLGNYNISILVIDANNFTLLTGAFKINDTAPPVISSSLPNDNNASSYFDPQNISFLATYTDTSLYSYRVDITRDNDTFNVYNTSAFISGTSFTFNQSINFSDQAFGTYTICHNVSDTHTATLMKAPTLIEEKTNSLKYTFGNTWVSITSLNGYEDGTVSTCKLDRCEFNFKYFDTTLTKKYEISSNENIEYLSDSKYKGHMIIGHHWLDMETSGTVTVVKDKLRNVYIVTVVDASKDIKFNSIGDRNFVIECFAFTTAETPVPDVYNNTIIDDTNWFNGMLFGADSSASIFAYFFILVIIIGMIIYAEYTKMPVLFLFAGLVTFFYGLLIYTKISAIVGLFVVLFGILLGFFSVSVANS